MLDEGDGILIRNRSVEVSRKPRTLKSQLGHLSQKELTQDYDIRKSGSYMTMNGYEKLDMHS